ncbi:type II secretion system minor pseudopilin GspK [Pseudomonas oryzihabitans]|uniref:type II secretion system minor pseudopilin GspK n=1 Tax=Pseudomonas oryzihabitans TaxID=47885 RepID=UPI00285A7872|nr:type II secretion system minor pseudopilin GspK [Pseudomonas psychrotolerans]MDR6679164.1 general secretion pathway protein K [Pseudomonas psychrotolerans]
MGLAHKQRGAALILVLSVVAIVCALASGMLFRQALMIRSTSSNVSAEQAWSYMLSGEALVTRLLVKDWQESEASQIGVDFLGEAWATPIKGFAVGNGELDIVVEDLQGRLDLNRILSEEGNELELMRLRNLFDLLSIDQGYIDRLVAWKKAQVFVKEVVGKEEIPSSVGGADATARVLFRDTSEFLLVGMGFSDYHKLESYIAALPVDTSGINVNTAPAVVLACLTENSDLGMGAALVEMRNSTGYQSVGEFIAKFAESGVGIFPGGLSVKSSYFKASFYVRVGKYRRILASIFSRDAKGVVRVVAREFVGSSVAQEFSQRAQW